jgi:hypothetical protein
VTEFGEAEDQVARKRTIARQLAIAQAVGNEDADRVGEL